MFKMARCQVHILLMFLFESGFNSQMILQQIRLFLKYCTFPTKCCSFGFAIAFTFPQFAPRPVLVIFYRSTDNNLQLGGSFGYRFNFFPTTGNNSHPGDSFGYNYNRGWVDATGAEQNLTHRRFPPALPPAGPAGFRKVRQFRGFHISAFQSGKFKRKIGALLKV